MDHFILLIWDALLISIFFTFLWREGAARRVFFLKCFTSLALGSFVAGWLMYFLS